MNRNELSLLLLSIATLCASCSPGRRNFEPAAQTKAFLALFKPFPADTLTVMFEEDNRDKQGTIGGRFGGIQLDTLFLPMIDTALNPRISIGSHFFACYRFPLSDTTCGLILRAPSLYEESSIQLSVFDVKHAKCLHTIELADLLGDGGATFQKFSLIRFEKGVISVSIRQIETGPADDKWEKFSECDSTSNYMLLNNQFILSSRLKNRDSTWIYTDPKL
jgi:hypothetical protein